jgi:pyruvate/oxaloacetate carboxyltransferase
MSDQDQKQSKSYVSLMDIKSAMKDEDFRSKLPESLAPEIQKFINNPSCSCNVPLYKKIIKEAKEQVLAYFPGKDVMTQEEEIERLSKNNWRVINCSIGDVEKEMKKLPNGRKQLAMARYEDQVTIIVNDLDVTF